MTKLTDAEKDRIMYQTYSQFYRLAADVCTKTILDPARLWVICTAAIGVQSVDGAIAELGVYRGGTAKMLAKMFRTRPVYLFDTFCGLPQIDPIDKLPPGKFNDTSEAEVKNYLADCENTIFRGGLFPDTATGLENVRFALVHLDADLYRSTLEGLRFFWPRIVPGGIIILDDIRTEDCPGVKQAVADFFLKNIQNDAEFVLQLPVSGILKKKPASTSAPAAV